MVLRISVIETDIHVLAMEGQNHLIRKDAPLTLIFTESSRQLRTYFESDLSDPDTQATLNRKMGLNFIRSLFDPFMASKKFLTIVTGSVTPTPYDNC